MAKYLKDILKAAHDTIKGVRPSETSTLSIGKDPGVDYKPKAGDEADFIAKHSVQKWDDPAGNPNFADKVSHALASPKEKLHGNTLPKAKAANEEVEQVEEGGMPASVIKSKQNRANMSDKEFADSHKDKSDADLRSMAWRHGHGKPGTPGHDHYVNRRNKGLKEEIEQIDELSTDLLHRAAHKAAKRAMGDAQGRSGPIFKKYAGMANKFRDKGMSQEKKEKAAKAVKEETDPGFSESKKAEDVLCNSTSQGTECPVHGMVECMSARPLKEISTKLALSYAKGSEKSMDTAAAKGSAGHETFMKRSAGHKLALDKTNPEHKRLKAKVGTTDANAKDAAYKKSIGEETVEEGAKVDRMVSHIKSSEKASGKSDEKAENIAWATANKRGMLDNKNKKVEEGVVPEPKSQLPNHGLTNSDASKMAKIAAMLKKEKKPVKEEYAVQPLLGGDQPPRGDSDEAAEMVKTELKALANKAMHLVMQMPDSMHVEPWCQAKIAQAKAYVNDVHDYMVYGEHDKEEEDEGTTDTPLTLPNMSVDVNTGQNV